MLNSKHLTLDFANGLDLMPGPLAIDTEVVDGQIYCLSFSKTAGEGFVVDRSDHRSTEHLQEYCNRDGLVVLHNALYDLPMLWQISIHPKTYTDTMVMAYLLQDLPLGLKDLAFRLCGLTMQSYTDVTHKATTKKSIEYLGMVSARKWPKPSPYLKWDGREQRLVQPTDIGKKALRIIQDVVSKGANGRERWHNIDKQVGRGMVEDELGPMPIGQVDEIDKATLRDYAAQDADATIRVYNKLWPRIVEEGLEDVLRQEIAIIPMILDMTAQGMQLDLGHFKRLSFDYYKMISRKEKEIWDQAGYKFNVGSDVQVGQLLFDELKLGKPNRTATGRYATGDDELIRIADRHRIVGSIRRYRELSTRKNTFIDPLPKRSDTEGRIHSQFRTTSTLCGRLSSAKPNFQNIPSRTLEATEVRKGFKAQSGCVFSDCDYGGIHLRLCAHITLDLAMVKCFVDDEDIHCLTASLLFETPYDDISKEQRAIGKLINFMILYGASPEKVLVRLLDQGITGYTAKTVETDLMDKWFSSYPGVNDYYKEAITELQQDEMARDMFGRFRRVPEVRSALRYVKEAGYRQGFNHFFLGAEQGVVKRAMELLTPLYKEFDKDYTCRPVLQLHDSIMFEVSEEIADVWMEVQRTTMEGAVKLVVPVKVDASLGRNWGECKYESMEELRNVVSKVI